MSSKNIIVILVIILVCIFTVGYFFKNTDKAGGTKGEDVVIDVIDSLTATTSMEISKEEKKKVLDSLSAEKNKEVSGTTKSGLSQEEKDAILKSLEAR